MLIFCFKGYSILIWLVESKGRFLPRNPWAHSLDSFCLTHVWHFLTDLSRFRPVQFHQEGLRRSGWGAGGLCVWWTSSWSTILSRVPSSKGPRSGKQTGGSAINMTDNSKYLAVWNETAFPDDTSQVFMKKCFTDTWLPSRCPAGSGFPWWWLRSAGMLCDIMSGGSGARLFFGISEGMVLESYVGEWALKELMLTGRCFLCTGDAGALTVIDFKERQPIARQRTSHQ